jgi:lipopolysaccharide export system permease protein
MLKIIDRYLIKEYLTRLVSVFSICFLIFIVQTFWLFIDELAGKGLDFDTILKFLVYYSPKLIPLVLPLSVVLASLMTFGSLAENYEFAAMKSTGISLFRAMTPLIILHIALGIGAFYFSNHVIPYGELKSYNLRKNLAKLKPAIAIREGVFNDLGQMSIKVKRKYGPDDRLLEDVIIHEKNKDYTNRIVIKAVSGELKSKTTDANLQLVLYDGNRYEEIKEKGNRNKYRHPHAKVHFKEYIMNIDLSQFNNIDLTEEKYTTTYRMQKVAQLRTSIDSLEINFKTQKKIFSENLNKKHSLKKVRQSKKEEEEVLKDTLFQANVLDFVDKKDLWKVRQTIQKSISTTKGIITSLENKKRNYFIYQKVINLHKIAFYDRFTLVFACIFLFLIGASIGAIIRKGGLGLPLVIAVIIFLSYHYIGIFGKNAAEDNSISPEFASWISTLIIAPFGYYLTKRANSDKPFINFDFITVPTYNLLKKYASKESA